MKKILLLTTVLVIICQLIFLYQKKSRISSKIIEVAHDLIPTPIITDPSLFHLIDTEFVEQAPEKKWDQPWQDACEEATLLTVHYFYQNQSNLSQNQKKEDILKIIKFEDSQGWGHDLNIKQLGYVAETMYGYRSEVISDPSIKEIKSLLSKNIPTIAPANGKILYQENKNFNNGGPWYHSLVILGFDDQKKQFIVHDVGTRKGRNFRYSYDLLLSSIHDWPASNHKEDINSGARQVLILLK